LVGGAGVRGGDADADTARGAREAGGSEGLPLFMAEEVVGSDRGAGDCAWWISMDAPSG
jgi:hypothetical protein